MKGVNRAMRAYVVNQFKHLWTTGKWLRKLNPSQIISRHCILILPSWYPSNERIIFLWRSLRFSEHRMANSPLFLISSLATRYLHQNCFQWASFSGTILKKVHILFGIIHEALCCMCVPSVWTKACFRAWSNRKPDFLAPYLNSKARCCGPDHWDACCSSTSVAWTAMPTKPGWSLLLSWEGARSGFAVRRLNVPTTLQLSIRPLSGSAGPAWLRGRHQGPDGGKWICLIYASRGTGWV